MSVCWRPIWLRALGEVYAPVQASAKKSGRGTYCRDRSATAVQKRCFDLRGERSHRSQKPAQADNTFRSAPEPAPPMTPMQPQRGEHRDTSEVIPCNFFDVAPISLEGRPASAPLGHAVPYSSEELLVNICRSVHDDITPGTSHLQHPQDMEPSDVCVSNRHSRSNSLIEMAAGICTSAVTQGLQNSVLVKEPSSLGDVDIDVSDVMQLADVKDYVDEHCAAVAAFAALVRSTEQIAAANSTSAEATRTQGALQVPPPDNNRPEPLGAFDLTNAAERVGSAPEQSLEAAAAAKARWLAALFPEFSDAFARKLGMFGHEPLTPRFFGQPVVFLFGEALPAHHAYCVSNILVDAPGASFEGYGTSCRMNLLQMEWMFIRGGRLSCAFLLVI